LEGVPAMLFSLTTSVSIRAVFHHCASAKGKITANVPEGGLRCAWCFSAPHDLVLDFFYI
jgi:hypothetical protein